MGIDIIPEASATDLADGLGHLTTFKLSFYKTSELNSWDTDGKVLRIQEVNMHKFEFARHLTPKNNNNNNSNWPVIPANKTQQSANKNFEV